MKINHSSQNKQQLYTNRFKQIIIYFFGLLSFYTLIAPLIESLTTGFYQNKLTNKLQPAESPNSFVFFQFVVSGFLLQFYIQVFNKKLISKKSIPIKLSFTIGILKTISILLFYKGLYRTQFRFAFMIKSAILLTSTIVGILYQKIGKQTLINKPNVINILNGLMITGGLFLVWTYDTQIVYYVPIVPRVIGTVMIIVSVLIDGIISVIQTRMCEKYKIDHIHLMRDVERFTYFFSGVYLGVFGDVQSNLEYTFKHINYFRDICLFGILSFGVNFIVNRAKKILKNNISQFAISGGMLLTVQISYAFTIQTYYKAQIVGLILAWVGILIAFKLGAQNELVEDRGQKDNKLYNQISILQKDEIQQ